MRRLASRKTATVKVMIMIRRKISGEFVEISLGNRFCDAQQFFPDGYTPPFASTWRAPYLARTGMGFVSFPDCRHVVIMAKSNRCHKEARKAPAHLAESDSR